MKTTLLTLSLSLSLTLPNLLTANDHQALAKSLTFHASFDKNFDADFTTGDPVSRVRTKEGTNPTTANDELVLLPNDGRFGGCLHFVKKGNTRPQYQGRKILNYNTDQWSTTVSVWLKLNPDKDLEPGYCDPLQIIGNDTKKGFIFLEWSKDETPRFFRFAMRPILELWNPNNTTWEDIPADKRPMVQIANAPFSRENWTHVVFTISNANTKNKPTGTLYLNGKLQGKIENWDLSFGWDPDTVLLVLGAYYVGHLDDLAVFDRALNEQEVQQLHQLPNGVSSLRP